MIGKRNNDHAIKFIKVRNGDRLNDSHEGSHLLGILPTPGRDVSAYLVYAIHPKGDVPKRRNRILDAS